MIPVIARYTAVTVLLLATVSGGWAQSDTHRLVQRPETTSGETRRLDIKPGDDSDDTLAVHWRRGWGGGGWRGWGVGVGWSSWGYGYGYGWGGWGGWYSPAFYSYSFATPYYYPTYSFCYPSYTYVVPSVSYYVPAPVVYVPAHVSGVESPRPDPRPTERRDTFRYDGGPTLPVPMPAPERIPPARNGSDDPKLGPAPGETKISLPAPKKYQYRAYGDPLPDTPKGTKDLYVRGK